MIATEDLLRTVDESWLAVLEPQREIISRIAHELSRLQAEGTQLAPAADQIFRSLRVPMSSVRVVLIGQDPYPTQGHAVGWSFSVPDSLSALPRSLRNIFLELQSDVGCSAPENGDLSGWVDQGVLLLNRSLSVSVGRPGSHRSLGWNAVTEAVVGAIALEKLPLAAILWGSDAQELASHFEPDQIISSVHPSPLSAHRGFFGSRPFSRANSILVAQGADPINWCETSASNR